MTLHDAWLLSGHCAHSFGCDRWKSGCGECPDLTIYPPIRADATAHNWRRKRTIYADSRLHVATPSIWLMNKVKQSILAPALCQTRVIPYGIDLSTFRPDIRPEIRQALDIPADARVLLFAAKGIRQNVWKDYQTMRAAIARTAVRRHVGPLWFIALGEQGPCEQIGQAHIRFVPFEKDPAAVARYYQSADLYLHAARADTFPNTVLEALACGTPVVATAVGGIPEQVRPLALGGGPQAAGQDTYDVDYATGVLVEAGDDVAMSAAIERLLDDDALRRRLSRNAARDAHTRFDLQRQADDYLDWYRDVLRRRAPGHAKPRARRPITAGASALG